jgi:translation initiation factor eIF-2B subunit epsilon
MLKGWGFPLAFETFGYKRERRNVYKSTEASISARGVLGPNVVVGKHTDIGENVVISNSIVGKNCRIASGVRITDAIVWDGVVVGQDSTVEHAVIGYSVTLGERVVVAAGCIVGNQVVVGDGVRLEPNTKLCAQAGDDEDEDDVSLKRILFALGLTCCSLGR